jgi:hypothetical protein
MAIDNAERQAKYRAKRKAEGLMPITIWINKGGGLARSDNGTWPLITKRQLDGVIKKAINIFEDDEMYKEAVYADIAEYVKMSVTRFASYRKHELRGSK